MQEVADIDTIHHSRNYSVAWKNIVTPNQSRLASPIFKCYNFLPALVGPVSFIKFVIS